jgi:EAL domain-containing protein (putative c-di-GMP-specific phosphodiesterase class I)
VIDSEHAAVPHYPAAVLRDADAALRSAKHGGRGRVAVFDSAMRTDAAQRLSDETDLAAAITDGDLELHYQPVIDLATGRPTGAEALVRWRRQGHGLVRPDLFIPLAEECGLIVDLGRWVLRRACLDAQDWATTVPALATGRVNVNVSTRQLVHPHFLDDVRAALADSGLPVERLVLEITESALIEDREHTLGVLAALRGMGLRLALDDFGTGYSSLSWLQDLPADVLKIDKSFIDPVTGPGQGTALARSSSSWPRWPVCRRSPRASRPSSRPTRCASWAASTRRATCGADPSRSTSWHCGRADRRRLGPWAAKALAGRQARPALTYRP